MTIEEISTSLKAMKNQKCPGIDGFPAEFFKVFWTKLKFFVLRAPIDILGSPLHPADSVRNLGVWFDSNFSFSKHVRTICKSSFIHMRDFRRIRRFLTHNASVFVANALVGSRLDYCNSLFRSLSKSDLGKLQFIQNSAARIVTNTSRYSSITPALKKLHWLPVEQRCVFKTVILVYKFLKTGFPQYFAPFLHQQKSLYNTRRSQNTGSFLVVPKISTISSQVQ